MRTITCVRCQAVAQRRTGRSSFCITCANERHLEALAAVNRIKSALYHGRLPRPATCECADCGKPATEYDHRDYTKPLEVTPVCRSCNHKRGPAFDSIYRPA